MAKKCDKCNLLFDSDKNYCRMCGTYLSSETESKAELKCGACELFYIKPDELCIHCSQPLEAV